MTVSKVNQSIFIGTTNGSYWYLIKIKIPSRAVKKCRMTGKLYKLSTTSSDHILAVVCRGDPTYYYIDLYETSDTLPQTKSIMLSSAIKNVSNVVQNSEKNFIFAYQNKDSEVNVISELSADGKKILRTFNPSALDVGMKSWKPVYLSIDENGDLFIAASYKKEANKEAKKEVKQAKTVQGVFFLNSGLNKFQVLSDQDNNEIDQIRSILLNEKKQLMIGHDRDCYNSKSSTYTVALSVYNLY